MAIVLTVISLILCQAFALCRKTLIRAGLVLFIINFAILKVTHNCKVVRLDKVIYTETLMNRPLINRPIPSDLPNHDRVDNQGSANTKRISSENLKEKKADFLFEEDRTFVF